MQILQIHTTTRTIVVFCISLFVYLIAPVGQSFDSRWSVLQAYSAIHNGDLRLDRFDFLDFGGREKRLAQFTTTGRDGERQSFFPLLPALFAVPAVITGEFIWCDHTSKNCPAELWKRKSRLEHITAALVTAATVAAISSCLFSLTAAHNALILTIALAFGSSCLSIFSRGLWQQTASCFFQALALAAILATKPRVYICGVCCSLAFFCRPTASLFMAALAAFVICNRLSLRYFIVGAVIGALPGALLNYQAFGEILSPYVSAGRLSQTTAWGEALLGNLISPARGLLVFSPWLLIVFAPNHWANNKLRILLVVQCLVHWVLVSGFPHWWGGYSYGPRLMSDILPSLACLAAISIDNFKSQRLAILLKVLVLVSIAIHTAGAFRVETQYWNTRPKSVDKFPERLWDFSDPPFLR